MELQELYKRVKSKETYHKKLNELKKQTDNLIVEVDTLEKAMSKEQKDVDKLEKGGLVAFFYDIANKKTEKLDKEKREAYEAKVKYDNAYYQLQENRKEVESYEEKIRLLAGCEWRYEEALEKRRDELRDSTPELVEFEEEMVASQLQQKEIAEALWAGKEALTIAEDVKKNLDDADDWATFDMFSDSIFADFGKYDALEKVEKLVKKLQAKLNSFKTELTDVEINAEIDVSIDEFLKVADYFFDNFFTDYEVMDKISSAKGQVNSTISQIENMIEHLQWLMEKENLAEKKAKAEIERIALERP